MPGGRGRAAGAGKATPTRCVRASNSSASRPAPTWVADDLGHLRRRGFQKGDRSGFVDRVKGAALGLGSLLDVKPVFSPGRWRGQTGGASPSFEKSAEKLFGHALARVQAGWSRWHRNWVSAMPAIPTALRDLPGFAALENAAASATSTCTWACSALPAVSTWAPGPEPGLHRHVESLCLRATRALRGKAPPSSAGGRLGLDRAGWTSGLAQASSR
ncbi:DegV family protein [Pseudomonas aeruginosa]